MWAESSGLPQSPVGHGRTSTTVVARTTTRPALRRGASVGHVSRSKTAVPGLPPEFVSRPALVSALDHGEDRALTLVCAPPGYGKTVLLADWAHRSNVACAWVALDEEDDDPAQLWASVLAALVGCSAVPASSRLRRLVVPRT